MPAALSASVVATLLVVTVAKAGAWRDDVTLWTATLVVHPRSAEARIALAAALAQEGRLEEARAVIQEATRLVPTDSWAAYIQGSIAEQMGARRAALRQYERSIALGKHDELAYSQAALLSARLHEWDRACGWFAAAAERFPQAAWPQVGLGWHHEREGRADQAREHFKRARLLEPTSPDRFVLLGRLLAAEGRVAEATEAFQRALNLDPSFLPARRALAVAAERQGDLAQAIEQWRNIATALPAGRYRGRILAHLHRLEAETPPGAASEPWGRE
jgi:tetratricopeptide (TPR) repeat protein